MIESNINNRKNFNPFLKSNTSRKYRFHFHGYHSISNLIGRGLFLHFTLDGI
ncbi:hypothetical protein LEP1GSC034_2087 [Leptospira interrogans str. 2003000735]|uniref:Uncharacterized protein n=2 Tax=Leptospira interrogans TaxID=173 RepID=A0A829D471_LEPIR|nr:hypothetical protein LEP1GSC007_4373 [Leptospira interrogans serovar Bulgarica str. Mallika]EKN87428.1 hypothetical protein LEP1GSC027_3042 [Leptospira interrogans str. 2002000624]EKO05748.1 hypothetical protein LEP1GSC077_2677 [Leptospira interrogans str. C10069]EKQ37384.1 hypothetical protein LEP1GSC025_0872 [Leptospira interrogans str. 2002000621]EKQ47669.1 hypothetical protein LEP1GSC026_4433 [Leptospira interrogans str. 2002000623]EKR17428.1 hypothetical protein LEP1GSC019_1920 [Leptos